VASRRTTVISNYHREARRIQAKISA